MNNALICYATPLLQANSAAKVVASMFRATAGFLVAALLLIFSPTVSFAQPPATGHDVAGTWTGALGSGAAKLNITLTITKLSSGEYSAELNSVDQGAVFPIVSFTLKGNALHFEVKSVGGVYDGTFNAPAPS